MRCRQLGLSPWFPGTPQRVTIGPLPITLLLPALALQKRDRRVRIPKRCWGPGVEGGDLCQYGGLPTEVKSEVQKAGKQGL